MELQKLLDRYSLENIPGITNLNGYGSPIDHEVFDLTLDAYFSNHMEDLEGVQGRHLVSYSRRDGIGFFSPLLRVVANKSHSTYFKNVNKFIELLTDGSVPVDTVERYLNHYIVNDNYLLDDIQYKPVLYYGRMDATYIKLFGKHGFKTNLPIIQKNRMTGELKMGLNSLGLIDEDIDKYGIDDSSDSYEDIVLTRGQKAADIALSLGADMNHRPENMLTKRLINTTLVNPYLRPSRQLYPPSFFSDKGYRQSLSPDDPKRKWNLYLDDQDRLEMEKRAPTTMLLQQLELLKPEQKLRLAQFFENTNIEGVDKLLDTLADISKHHDTMNPYVTRDASGRRMNTRYLKDKQKGGKKTKKKQRGGTQSKKKGRRSKKKNR